MTYAQAAELTWPQLLHAMGIDPNVRDDDSAERIVAAQDAVFDEMVRCRRCWPMDLLRMAVGDLVGLATVDGVAPSIGALLASLKRYVNDRMEF